jgi:hypothetical protein
VTYTRVYTHVTTHRAFSIHTQGKPLYSDKFFRCQIPVRFLSDYHAPRKLLIYIDNL